MTRIVRLVLRRIEFMPKALEPGILYVSDEFGVAGHLCACGCGNKVITPLGAAQWSFYEQHGKPTLTPSIGSWQLHCKSHYWIRGGEIHWARGWTAEAIAEGREDDMRRLREFYEPATSPAQAPSPQHSAGPAEKVWDLVRRLRRWVTGYFTR